MLSFFQKLFFGFPHLVDQVVQAVDSFLLPVHGVQQLAAVPAQDFHSLGLPVLAHIFHELTDAGFIAPGVPQILFNGFLCLISQHNDCTPLTFCLAWPYYSGSA